LGENRLFDEKPILYLIIVHELCIPESWSLYDS